MDITIATEPTHTLMHLSGRFDFSVRNAFSAAFDKITAMASTDEICIDMTGVNFIDSSALGMLLVSRDKARKLGKTIMLQNAQGYVRQVLDTSQFERLFPLR